MSSNEPTRPTKPQRETEQAWLLAWFETGGDKPEFKGFGVFSESSPTTSSRGVWAEVAVGYGHNYASGLKNLKTYVEKYHPSIAREIVAGRGW